MNGQTSPITEMPTGRCPSCGAVLEPEARRCWLCREPVPEQLGESPFLAQVVEPIPAAQFSLASLMLVMTLIAIGFGIASIKPGLGIVYGIILFPAFLRTAVMVQRKKRRGQKMHFYEKASSFIVSIAVIGLAGMSASIAFFGTCLVTCFVGVSWRSAEAFWVGTIVASMLALCVAGFIIYTLSTSRFRW